MGYLATTIRLALGAGVSVGALAAASRLGVDAGAEAALANTAAAGFMIGAVTASLLHVPGHFLVKGIDALANGMDARLSRLRRRNRLPGNEHVLRLGREAALCGVKLTVDKYFDHAKDDYEHHDLDQARAFRRAAMRWLNRQIAEARRPDRPENRRWDGHGFVFDAIAREPFAGDIADPRVAAHAAAAWGEFCKGLEGVEIPAQFKSFFEGGEFTGWGWRRAGHRLAMDELKRNRAAFVGFIVDAVTRA